MGKSKSPSPELTKALIGYGHYQLTVTYSDYVKTAITGNMELIDRLNSDVEKGRSHCRSNSFCPGTITLSCRRFSSLHHQRVFALLENS